jgi:hypothetical protein
MQSGVSRKHRSRELSNRVRFDEEVQQFLYIPETVYNYTNSLPIYEEQESITIDADVYDLRMLLDYQPRNQRDVAAATNAFQGYGEFLSSRVLESRSTFEFFDSDGVFPYYTIMYYGAVGKAAFGAILIIVTLVHVFAAG